MADKVKVKFEQTTDAKFNALVTANSLVKGSLYFALNDDGSGTIYEATSENTYIRYDSSADVSAEATARKNADDALQENIDTATTPAEIQVVTEDTGYTKEEIDAKLADYILITDIIPYEEIINLE